MSSQLWTAGVVPQSRASQIAALGRSVDQLSLRAPGVIKRCANARIEIGVRTEEQGCEVVRAIALSIQQR